MAKLKHMACHNISESWNFYKKFDIFGIFPHFKSAVTITITAILKALIKSINMHVCS